MSVLGMLAGVSMHRLLSISVLSMTLLVASCAALVTSYSPDEGVPYFLPQTLVKFVVDVGNPAASKMDTIDVADRGQSYYLSYRSNSLADENLCIHRSKDGLLSKVYFGAQDRSSDILLNVVELIARIAPDGDELGDGSPPVACSGIVESEFMDPYDAGALQAFNEDPRLCGVKVTVPNLPIHDGTTFASCPSNAVCFATKSTYVALVSNRDGSGTAKKIENAVASKRDIGWIKVRGAFFNKRITMMDFDGGILTTLRIRKDSELLGVSQLPLGVIERVLAVPGNALGMAFAGYKEKVLYLERQKQLTTAGATAPSKGDDADSAISSAVLGCAAKG